MASVEAHRPTYDEDFGSAHGSPMDVLSNTSILALVLWQGALDCELGQAILKGRAGVRHGLV